MKIAVVHDWLVVRGGAERVLEAILEIYPEADVFTIVYIDSVFRGSAISKHKIYTSFIDRLPFGRMKYRMYLPFMPLAIEQFDLSGYDLVITSSYAVAKGVITGPDQLHISYVHSPIRYAWDLQTQYLHESGYDKGIKSWIVRWQLHKIRMWDVRTSNGVDQFIANSEFIARRIWKVYRRKAEVIYPPIDITNFSFVDTKKDFYLTASRMVPYKKIALIVQAFGEMPEKKLVVIGDGPDIKKIMSKASDNIEILGYQSFDTLRNYMQQAKAFVFAAEEDFGITPVEAMACGTPVIAYGKGGVLETVICNGSNPTGLFFDEQSVNAICNAVELFERNNSKFHPSSCRERAEKFSSAIFKKTFSNLVDRAIQDSKIVGFSTEPVDP